MAVRKAAPRQPSRPAKPRKEKKMQVSKPIPRQPDRPKKPAASGKDFVQLMSSIPIDVFVRMVTKSGLPSPEARELCDAFKRLQK